jgi:NADP-dependent 3-hydroxy acid dehydrogenase YdfG
MAEARHKPIAEQVIVITGASSGIGLATAQAAALQGARLVLAARSSEAPVRIANRLAEVSGCDAIAVTADVGHRADVQHVVDAAIGRYGRIGTWVNDAGVGMYGRLEEVDEKDSRRLFDTNFWGVAHGSLAALPHLKVTGEH